ncbi:mucolipin-3-like isoform X2 [Anneissia japonica]|nr:mucolipin-3-like isoform X2 [Anneissia japonica]XP_033121437.1 mucolipin-3-like isoform X2 [Anneissia japonica]
MDTSRNVIATSRSRANTHDSSENGSMNCSYLDGHSNKEECMRRQLKYFFMNTWQKYKAKGRKPWKLVVQLLKIIVVTIQLWFFGYNQFSLVTFLEGNKLAFEHMFMLEWDVGYDAVAYPNTRSLYAIYEKDEFYEHVNHAVNQFTKLEDIAIGSYDYVDCPTDDCNITLCQTYYKNITTASNSYSVNINTVEYCLDIPVHTSNFSLIEFLYINNEPEINFDRLVCATLKFSVKSFLLRTEKHFSSPDCILFHISILFSNEEHNGRIKPEINQAHEFRLQCTRSFEGDNVSYNTTRKLLMMFDIVVALLSLLSFVLCCRSLCNARKMKKKTVKFFLEKFNKSLTSSDRLKFYDFWLVEILVSDLLVMFGSMLKLQIEQKNVSSYDLCSVLLGIGCLLVWCGILRYLGFSSNYNILILTMKNAMPNMMRFLICAGTIYMGYAFCGWIVLGPYHYKFRTLTRALECMYSLVNGDDMFATFAEMSKKSYMIWVFSKAYLYSFISLFIYVVLSLFIAVIMDTYETLKDYQKNGWPMSELMTFVNKCTDLPESGCFRVPSETPERSCLSRCFGRRRDNDTSSDYLISS